MNTIKMKTNIMCGSCIAKVTPVLDEAAGKDNWKVDTANPAKILTLTNVEDENKIIGALEKIGYKAEVIA
ncbi:MAG TPA: cation transporter [Flavisolibacter sp.]|nr:cation transporter [Flavisolibacter sp.]